MRGIFTAECAKSAEKIEENGLQTIKGNPIPTICLKYHVELFLLSFFALSPLNHSD